MGRRSRTAPVTPEQAVEELRNAGYEPEEPYPGKANEPWRVFCAECNAERTVRLTQVRHGHKRCAHTASPGMPDETPKEREYREKERCRELRWAGYRAMEPPPRLARTVMDVECLSCGAPRRVSMTQVREGRRCYHTSYRMKTVRTEEVASAA